MKKSFKLLFASLAITLGIGAAAVAGVSAHSFGQEKAEKVEAASSVTIYVNHFNPGSDKGGSWSNFKYYLFGTGGNNGWPGVAFTDAMKTSTPNEYDEYQYKLVVDTSKYQSLVLTGNSDSSWGGSFAKTEDFDLTAVTSTTDGLYCGAHKGWQTDANVFSVGTYNYSTKTVYLLDLKGNVYSSKHYCHAFATGKTGTTWPGVAMTKVSGSNNIYSAEINSALNNIMFNNNGSNQTDSINAPADGDLYCVYPDNGYNKLTLDAGTFIDKYMKFETVWLDNGGTGACKTSGWYTSAKSAFSGKTAAQKTAILAHEPTQYRLAAWAKANGDTFNTSTGAFSTLVSYNVLRDSANGSSTIVVVIAISLLSVAAVGGYFLLRKKRHQ